MFILLLLSIFAAQKQAVLIKVIAANGQQMGANAMIKGFERWINPTKIDQVP